MKPDNECAAYGKEIECLETICGNLCIDPLTGDPDPTCGACFFSCPKCAVNCTTCSSEAGAIIPFVKNAANKEKPGCYPLCGDEVISGDEQCDDGNLSNGDGCDMICSVESGWTCNGEPSICTK
jgi:cysteine-rich repeat protein